MSERAVKTVNSSNVMSSNHFHYAVLICHTYNLAMADCITDGIMSFSIRSDLPQLLAREPGLYTAYKTFCHSMYWINGLLPRFIRSCLNWPRP